MTRTLTLLLSAALLLAATACGGSNPGSNPGSDTNNGGDNNGANNGDTNNANNGGDNNGDTNNGGDNNGDTNNGANNGGEVVSFTECDGDGDCNASQACMVGVCVEKPLNEVEGEARYERGDTTYLAGQPEVGCFATPTPSPVALQYLPTQGKVQKFGVGGATVGLCVTAYNADRFMEHFLSICQGIEDAEELQECYQVDPCRCEKDNAGDQGAIDDCFAGIGYCNGIQDGDKQASCREQFAFDGENGDRDASFESTLIYSHATSESVDGGDEGFYRMDKVPTNTRLVYKVSGRTTRWVDTYEFGVVLVDVNEDDQGQAYASWEGNVISIGAWSTIPSTALVPQGIQAGNGAIAGTISDCGKEDRTVEVEGEQRRADYSLPIKNATVGLTHDATRITYFNGNPDDTLPLPSQVTTNALGVYAAVNVPGGPNRVSTAMYKDGELVNIGYRDVFLPPRSVAISTFESNWEPSPW